MTAWAALLDEVTFENMGITSQYTFGGLFYFVEEMAMGALCLENLLETLKGRIQKYLMCKPLPVARTNQKTFKFFSTAYSVCISS